MAAFLLFWVERSNPIHALIPRSWPSCSGGCFGVMIPPGKAQGCHMGLS